MGDSPFEDLDVQSLAARDGMKWSKAEPGTIACWVADMDFPVPPPVREALIRRVDTDLGYPAWAIGEAQNPLAPAFAERMERRYGWRPDPAHVRCYNDINQALQVVLVTCTRPGDAVAMHTPAYTPFLQTLGEMERPLLPIPMEETSEGWEFDLDRLDRDLRGRGCRALVLVNPQNPTGRAFRRPELEGLAELAERHDLLVIADEIHADLTYAPRRHIPFASVSPDAAARTITLTSATKAFNLAGIRCCVAHVAPAAVREALAAQPQHLFGEVSVFGVDATLAAWREGDAWLDGALRVLDRNRRLIAERLPVGARYHVPEATYLAWLDLRAFGLGPDPAAHLLAEARVMTVPGPSFGPGGDGFARLNFATSTGVLQEILARVAKALPAR
ncbi:aminotransferase class I/II-fold pyridoxal phosphate-dependent enzyme [Bailinhaonella thermotolerans]|uniref:cysteine-S-conjugate beta-lyase n=2 Tax=Bailinhaonella thermotolerans TaxID=1070861 RepID=A0A3A4B7Z2_9ACTN|nr:aminotransferase class I/II-fold pyridoxal phosphate-dependent enzyme [Bailinhaonella thermotolerans]